MNDVNPTTDQVAPLVLPTPAEALRLNQEFWGNTQEQLITTATELLTQKIITEVLATLQGDNMRDKFRLFESKDVVTEIVDLGKEVLRSVFSSTMKEVLSNDELDKLHHEIPLSAFGHNIRDPRAQILFRKDEVDTILAGVKNKILQQGWDIKFHTHQEDRFPNRAVLSTAVTPKDNQNGNNSGRGGAGGGR